MKTSINKKYNGLQWFYESDNGDTLSVICHDFSYGSKAGLFETQCSWLNDVQGSLTFKQVAQKIETIYKREKASHDKQN